MSSCMAGRSVRAAAHGIGHPAWRHGTSEDGTSEIIGDQKDRAKAEAAYQNAIQAFEQHSKLRFSSYVTSEVWQKTFTRTCSVELPE